MKEKPLICSYYFPNWHVDPRNETIHGKGWTEWRVTHYATPRFEGHKQPKQPLRGYEDEADPAVMERKIADAVSHGIDAFIFDWYYFEDGSFVICRFSGTEPLLRIFAEDGSADRAEALIAA